MPTTSDVPCKKCFEAQHVWLKKDGEVRYSVRCKLFGVDLEMEGEIPVQLAECQKQQAAESGQKG